MKLDENGGDPDLKVFIEPTEQTMIQALERPAEVCTGIGGGQC